MTKTIKTIFSCSCALALAVAVLLPISRAAAATKPPIQHVFIVVLENEGFSTTFGPHSPAAYLNGTLVPAGALLTQYYGTGHVSLDNYVAMVSGQGPNPMTMTDCQVYLDFVGLPVLGLDGQAIGLGCVYPTAVQTISNQLEAKHLTWRGYMEDMGNNPIRDGGITCAHPTLNTQDGTQSASASDQYAARHNPFVYFHSIIDNVPDCNSNVVPLTQLSHDLASITTTPNYVFITPNLCHDGHDAACADGETGGLAGADRFLSQLVPTITGSPAYKQDGMLTIIFDEAANTDAGSCCGPFSVPVVSAPSVGSIGGSGLIGGGLTGAVALSRFVAPKTVSIMAYNHYALLRTVEDLFDLNPLGFAASKQGFGADVYSCPAGNC
jgi:hypothetical protein